MKKGIVDGIEDKVTQDVGESASLSRVVRVTVAHAWVLQTTVKARESGLSEKSRVDT
jgi:hypothetical protein